MKDGSAIHWLRRLGVSVCDIICYSGAAHADTTNAGFGWQGVAPRRHFANFLMHRLDDVIDARSADKNGLRIGTNTGAIKVSGGAGGLLQVAANSTLEAKNSSVATLGSNVSVIGGQ